MNILDASLLFSRADTIRTQLEYISGHNAVSQNDRQVFEFMSRTLDKIYMSANTRKHRQDLQDFIMHNEDKIYKKYTELSNVVLKNDDTGLLNSDSDCYDLKPD